MIFFFLRNLSADSLTFLKKRSIIDVRQSSKSTSVLRLQ